MATNKILPFAQDPGANVITDAEYAALTALLADGFLAGIAHSNQMNKVWRQSSVIAAGVAQFLADHQAVNIDDSLTAANISTYLSNALSASGVFTTPAQFDNTTKAATTAFVRSAKGGTAGINAFNASTTLTLADVGKQIFFYGSTAAQTLTLPEASTVPAGEGYWITNQASVSVTLKGNGSQNLSINLAGSGQSLSNTTVLKPGDSLFVPSSGASQWNLHGYTSGGQFPSSLGASGYQKLPSGLILQWGSATAVTTGTAVTLPIAFPTACRAHGATVNAVAAPTQYVGTDANTTAITIYSNTGPAGCRWWAIGD